MFVTLIFYLGAEKNRFTIALQYRSCELVNLYPRGLPGKLALIGILVARGCLKNLFFIRIAPSNVINFLSGLKCLCHWLKLRTITISIYRVMSKIKEPGARPVPDLLIIIT